MSKRRTKRNADGTASWAIGMMSNGDCEKLCDFEDAEEQGRLIEFPVAIGQHVYEVWPDGNYVELTVTRLEIDWYGEKSVCADDGRRNGYSTAFSVENIGKTIFLTLRDAGLKLAGMEEKSISNGE